MADDGAGQEILAAIQSTASEWGGQVELVDGGTQGLALLGKFEGRKAVVFLDAVRLGDKAGAVHLFTGAELLGMGGRSTTAHEGSAPDILKALHLLGDTPPEVVLIGIEPEKLQIGIGLSREVRAAIPVAAGFARLAVNRALAGMAR
jgi:hydrogenase maturation protease